jgi:hypothetical protein
VTHEWARLARRLPERSGMPTNHGTMMLPVDGRPQARRPGGAMGRVTGRSGPCPARAAFRPADHGHATWVW